MGLLSNPQIVTENLIFYYDMYNLQKSFKGKPITNFYTNGQFANGQHVTQAAGGSLSNPINTVVEMANPGDSPWCIRTTSVGGSPYTEYELYLSSTLIANTTYCLSCWYALTGNWDGNNTVFHSRWWNSDGSEQGSLGGTSWTVEQSQVIGGITWYRVYTTFTTGATTNGNHSWYAGYPAQNTKGYRYFTNFQIEVGSTPSRFSDGTRSNTQAIVDLTGQNVITAQSLTYASDNTFSFSAASSNYIDSGYDLSWNNTNSASIDFWCRPTTTSQNVGIIGKGSDWEWQVRQNGDAVQFVYWDTGGSHNNGPIPIISSTFAANVWKHIAVVWSHTANQLYIYANGALISTSNWTNAAINANKSNTVKIGGLIYDWVGGGSYWSGSIAAVKLYSAALTPSEVQQNFNALRGRFGL